MRFPNSLKQEILFHQLPSFSNVELLWSNCMRKALQIQLHRTDQKISGVGPSTAGDPVIMTSVKNAFLFQVSSISKIPDDNILSNENTKHGSSTNSHHPVSLLFRLHDICIIWSLFWETEKPTHCIIIC